MKYRKIWKPGGHPRRGMGSMKPGRRQLQALTPRGTILCKSANRKSRGNWQKKKKTEGIEKGYNKTDHHRSAGLERISSSAYADVSGVGSEGSSSLARYSFTLP